MKFRKKPVEIEAMKFMGPVGIFVDALYALEFDDWIDKNQGERKCRYSGQNLIISTLEGEMEAIPGDIIIKGIQGELYPCKPDIFTQTYEKVE